VEKVNLLLARNLWLQVVLSVLCAAAVVLVLFPGSSVGSVLLRLAVSSIGGVIVLVVVRSREKRAIGGSSADVVSLDAKLRKGDVPSAPEERRAMRELVGQRLHRTRHRRAALVMLFVLVAMVVAGTALTAQPRASVGIALFSGVFLAWLAWFGHVQIRRLRHMDQALRDERRPAAERADAPGR
jgi:peptidoglycan/LPS O-acetylase OafA/YrhL